MIVEAEDENEINPQRGKTLLVFTVKDVNDNYPEITVIFIVYSEGNTGRNMYIAKEINERLFSFYFVIRIRQRRRANRNASRFRHCV